MKPILLSQQATRLVAVLVIALSGVSKTSAVFSQAQLVKDMNTSEYRHFNEYSQLTNAQGYFFFVSNGKELWRSDGTPQGTRRLKTIRHIENLTLIDNTLFFSGTDVSGAELWKSDGTSAGTLRLKDIRKGLAGSSPKTFTSINGTIYFVADNGTGPELWKTNGTSTGTVLVKDIWTGTSGSEPSYLTTLNELLYFSADDGIHGRELWRTDGTNAGTVMVKDIQTTEGESSEPQEMVTLNDFLYFSAYHASSGRELWRSNGTPSGTIRLRDINPGPESSGIGSIRRMGNAIYFNANNGTTGTALWRSSGTTAGTAMLKDLTDDNLEYLDLDMTVLNNRLYWVLGAYSGHEVWVSNGTAAGTKLATVFDNRDTPAQFTYLNNKVYFFTAYWSQDPYAPYQQLSSINPDGSDWREVWSMWPPFTVGGEEDELWYDFTMDIIAFNNSLFFPGVRNETEGYKLLKSDGTLTPPTILIDTYRPTRSSMPNSMVKNNSDIYFATSDNDWDNQHLWRTDGTTANTIRIKSESAIGNVISMNNTIYFTVRGPSGGWQLWKTDGMPTSTIVLKEDYTHDFDAVTGMVEVGGRLFFYTYQGELWTSDGTAAGTLQMRTFSWIEHVESSGNVAYVIVRTASGGQELWKSNGTRAGTVKVRTIRSIEGPTSPNHLASETLGNIFYFVAHNGTQGQELWRTDGTNAGTYMVKDIRTGDNDPYGSDILRMTAFNNALYINANDASGELSLFKSDGTSAGTVKLSNANRIIEFMPYHDKLLYVTSDYHTLTLWTIDDTGGVNAIMSLPPSYELSLSYVQANNVIYLTYQGSNLIWQTDGTECGTFGIDVGLKNINNLAPISSTLLFSANHPFYGNELFSFDAGTVTAPSCPETWAARAEASDESDKEVLYTPNPFEHDFNFVVRTEIPSTAEMAVYDMAGHPVAFEKLDTNKSYQLGNSWKEGLYILRIVIDGKVTYKRVVKSSQ